jgi:nucleotide-binding universal stress UspA family protein
MQHATTSRSALDGASDAPVFESVLCGIDGSRGSLIAARHAGVMATGGRLRLLAITWEQGVGATATAVLGRWRAGRCLDRAAQDLHGLDVRLRIDIIDDPNASERLLREAAPHDLLVLGMHARSRPGGILLGDTASVALHRATVPVLVARPLAPELGLLDRILFAHDGTDASRAAARVTAQLAHRHGSEVALVAACDHQPARRHAVAQDAAAILEATGYEPVVLDEHCKDHHAITAAAATLQSTLVIVGSRGLAGASALRSTSERVAHHAHCSVLVMRPRQ